MGVSNNEIYCNIRAFIQDIPNVKDFLKSLLKYDIHDKGISWQIIEYGAMIEINFVTTKDKADEIKKEYESVVYDLYLGR